MSSFPVACPCGCGNAVPATDAGFTATRVTVECCEASLIGSVSMPKSWAYAEALPATGLRHTDGLVVFA